MKKTVRQKIRCSVIALIGLSGTIAGVQPLGAQTFQQVHINLEKDSMDELEAHPFTNEDVHGSFVGGEHAVDTVELHYRGAYYLWSLIRQGSYRNWKVKTSKKDRYKNRREWNFNYELHLRQRLAYFLMHKAGVPCVSAEHVVLYLNGRRQGIYLQFEDPDNKRWLKETFGDNDGDLYKAAYDMPNETKYFADLSYLGPLHSDYYLHYRKQTNNKGSDEFDYSSIRAFTKLVDQTRDEDFEQVIYQNFNVNDFIKYLVVANFMSHWDGYPFRPKNYFLYNNPEDGKWNFIPWDMDGTFQDYGNLNSLRTTASVFHYFDAYAPYNKTPNEPTDRPLVWNLMKHSTPRDQYILEYKKAIETYLNEDYLNHVIDSLRLGIRDNANTSEERKFYADIAKMRAFIEERSKMVISELSKYEIETNMGKVAARHDINSLVVYPNPSKGLSHVVYHSFLPSSISLYAMNGQKLLHFAVTGQDVYQALDLHHLENGNYLLQIDNGSMKKTSVLSIKK